MAFPRSHHLSVLSRNWQHAPLPRPLLSLLILGFSLTLAIIHCLLRSHSPDQNPAITHQLIPCPPLTDYHVVNETTDLFQREPLLRLTCTGLQPSQTQLCLGCKSHQKRTCSSSGPAQSPSAGIKGLDSLRPHITTVKTQAGVPCCFT